MYIIEPDIVVFSFNILQCQQYRTPCQAFTILPAVNPQLFCVLPIPTFSYFIRKWQTRVSFKFHTRISQNHSSEVFFCWISPPMFHRSVSLLPLCSNTNLFFLYTWVVHTLFIWQVRGNGGFGKIQS